MELLRLCSEHRKASRRLVCAQMQAILPRELRDMVYERLLASDSSSTVRISRNGFSCQCWKNGDSNIPGGVAYALPCRVTSQLNNGSRLMYYSEILPIQTLSELAETWYRISLFIVHDFHDLGLFLISDNWAVGLKAQDHIRALKFFVNLNRLQPPGDEWYRQCLPCQQRRDPDEDPFTTLKAYLGSLLALKKEAFVFIDLLLDIDVLDTTASNIQAAELRNTLRSGFAAFREVQEHGVRLMFYPRFETGETWSERRMIRMLNRPLFSAEEWLSCVRSGLRAIEGGEEDGDITRSERTWYNLLHA